MIEDNDQDYVIFDEELTTDIHIIKSVFKKLIGNIQLIDEADCKKLHNDISLVKNTNNMQNI